MNYQRIRNVQYACRLNIRVVLRELEEELGEGFEESLCVEDTKKGLQNIWRILNNFWLVEILRKTGEDRIKLSLILLDKAEIGDS